MRPPWRERSTGFCIDLVNQVNYRYHMLKIPTHEAKTHLSKYLDRAARGETIVITRGNRPMAKLVTYEDLPGTAIPKVGQMLDERMEIPREAFAPLSKSEMGEWGL